ncbi:MAG: chorismate mutase [Bdellovibrionales bacterium]|nr:chorismate mutase [Bdellovibrionales bacterium]
MSQREIRRLRREMDALNRKLVSLYLRRVALAVKITEKKTALGWPAVDPAREKEMLALRYLRSPRARAMAREFLRGCFLLTKRHGGIY